MSIIKRITSAGLSLVMAATVIPSSFAVSTKSASTLSSVTAKYLDAENGKEIVVMGRGIGFKCREGDSIPPEAIEKIFHMDTQNETDRLKQLFSSMPLEHIEVTNRIIAYARKILGKRLNHSIYITLTDHISFSVLRFRQNMMFHNALLAEMRRFYPQEYSIGQYALDLIAKELGVRFPDDEAASIAMHIVNAEYDISLGEAVDITHLIDQMLRIVRDWHRRPLDETSVDFDRFVTHLKFLAQRALRQDRPPAGDRALYDAIAALYPGETACAHRVGAYLGDTHSFLIGDLEAACLAIHIRRVTAPDA